MGFGFLFFTLKFDCKLRIAQFTDILVRGFFFSQLMKVRLIKDCVVSTFNCCCCRSFWCCWEFISHHFTSLFPPRTQVLPGEEEKEEEEALKDAGKIRHPMKTLPHAANNAIALWSRTTKNQDVSTGPLAWLFLLILFSLVLLLMSLLMSLFLS